MTATMDRLDDEVTTDAADTFTGLLGRLNDQSVRPGKHFDAYVDVPWDEHPIDPTDPRWELDGLDPLGKTAWYQSQPQEVRAAIGLHGIASKMQVGYFFEGVLKRGLLEHATTLPAGSPELRYVYHEVIEEAQHSLMFQEFAGRAGYGTVPKLPRQAVVGSRRVVKMARVFPELFFIFVLGGEDPIDHVQRAARIGDDVNVRVAQNEAPGLRVVSRRSQNGVAHQEGELLAGGTREGKSVRIDAPRQFRGKRLRHGWSSPQLQHCSGCWHWGGCENLLQRLGFGDGRPETWLFA